MVGDIPGCIAIHMLSPLIKALPQYQLRNHFIVTLSRMIIIKRAAAAVSGWAVVREILSTLSLRGMYQSPWMAWWLLPSIRQNPKLYISSPEPGKKSRIFLTYPNIHLRMPRFKLKHPPRGRGGQCLTTLARRPLLIHFSSTY